MMYDWNGDGSGMWIMMVVMFLVFLLLFAMVAAFLVVVGRRGTGYPVAPAQLGSQRALQILDERLARGEIGPEEYQNLRTTLLPNGMPGI